MISERAAGYLWHHYATGDPWADSCSGTRAYCPTDVFTDEEATQLMERIKQRVEEGEPWPRAIHAECTPPYVMGDN